MSNPPVSAARSAGDGFGLVRIAAATMVLFSHAFPLAGEPELVLTWRGLAISFGNLAVRIFFVVSGYLITSSWTRDPTPRRYVLRRFARIWPGLLVMLLVTAYCLGPLVTTVAPATYVRDGNTLAYVLSNLLMVARLIGPPGVFAHNPLPAEMNQSLWTLPIEVFAYLLLLAIGGCLNLRHRRWPAAVMTAGVVALTVGVVHVMVGDAWLTLLARFAHEPLLLYFAAGSALYLLRDRLPNSLVGVALAVAVVASLGALGRDDLMFFPIGYLVIYVCTRRGRAARAMERRGDPSYGMYIYGFPVQQALVSAGLAPNPIVLFILATAVSAALGYLSWHLVEKSALGWAGQINARARDRRADGVERETGRVQPARAD